MRPSNQVANRTHFYQKWKEQMDIYWNEDIFASEELYKKVDRFSVKWEFKPDQMVF